MRIGIIALLHESNTFSPQPTTIEQFRENTLLEGEAIRDALADTHHEIGGFFGGLQKLGAEAVPLFAARALPSGTIGRDTFAELLQRLWQTLDGAGELDGLLVAPHGATVSEEWPDADGHWLQQLRRRVGSDMPIVGTLDPHANLSPAMVTSCHALLAYRTNPHLDQRRRGEEAADLIVRTVRGEIQPTMAAMFPPLAISIDRQCTDEPPLEELCRFADDQRQRPGVLTNSVFLGFPYADVGEMGSAAIVVTDNDPSAAERLVRELAGRMWELRRQFAGVYTGVEEALDQVAALTGPVCLLDMGDNVGGGSSADGTEMLAALARRQTGPTFVCLYDPQAVAACEQAGAGRTLSLSVGGKTDTLHGPPVSLELTVRSLHDGRFLEPQPRHGGMCEFDQGRTAVCTSDWGLTLMLTSRRMVPFSLQQLVSCDVDPRQFRVLVAKGVNAPLAAYREVCPEFIRVNTAGSTCADMQALSYMHRRRPMFPFEADTDWEPETADLTRGA
jgi:microcystin degradation protein MlrC